MTWTRLLFTDAQIAAGECYRLQRRFTQVFANAHCAADLAMFSTAFLPGRQATVYFSPGVSAEVPSFVADVGAHPCERPEASVSLWVGAIDARDLLAR